MVLEWWIVKVASASGRAVIMTESIHFYETSEYKYEYILQDRGCYCYLNKEV